MENARNISVAFFDAKPYDADYFDKENLNYGFSFKFFKERLTIDTVPMAAGHDVVCVFVNDSITSEVVERLHSMGVKLIALRCAGYNNVDFKAAFGKMHVVRVPAYSPYSVAEHAVALMMSLNRKTHRAFSRVRENNFSIVGLLGFDMHSKTAGLIGAGNIGRILAGILKGFGMRVVIFDRSRPALCGVGRHLAPLPSSSLDSSYDRRRCHRQDEAGRHDNQHQQGSSHRRLRSH